MAAWAQAFAATASIKAVGNQQGVVRSTQSNRSKRRHIEQAKGADRTGPKGTWPGPGAPNSPGADVEPPAERRGLTHAVSATQRGKPVALPRSREAARPTDGAAGKGRGSKRMPAGNRLDRG